MKLYNILNELIETIQPLDIISILFITLAQLLLQT